MIKILSPVKHEERTKKEKQNFVDEGSETFKSSFHWHLTLHKAY